MKLLLDENISRRVVPFIQDLYPESTQVALVGLENTDGKVIRQYAIDNDFVIVTKDADFYNMTVLYGQPPKIVWLLWAINPKPPHTNLARPTTSNRASTNNHACIEIL